MREFEALLEELGLPWALHKRRGPARVMAFLGLLLVNRPGESPLLSLTEKRVLSMVRMVDEWLARRPTSSDEARGVTVCAAPR